MMFSRKRFIAVILLFIIWLSVLAVSDAAAMAQEKEAPSAAMSISDSVNQKAEILLVYNLKPSDMEIKSIEELVKALTYLQHSVVYLPVNQCEDIVTNYRYVICYNLGSEGNSFMDRLVSLNKKVMILSGEAVTEYVKASGYPILVQKEDDLAASLDYSFSEQNSASALIRLQNTYLLGGSFAYRSGTLSYENKTASLYSQWGLLLYSPCYDFTNGILAASFANEAAIWMWSYKGQPHKYSQYLVLDGVYPFFPPEQLFDIVNYIIGLKLPFVISVMPIYQNGDYPAMKRFCEILRYAQANNGTIILHAPNTVLQEDDKEQRWNYYTYATKAYTNYGIYPLAVQVPEKFLFNQTDREIIERYTTVFCYKDEESSEFDIREQYNRILQAGHLLIAPSYQMNLKKNCQIPTLPSAAYIDITQNTDQVKKDILACVKAEVPLKNLRDIDQNVYGNDLYIHTKDSMVFFNGEKVSLDYIPFTYDKYKYKSGVFQWIAKDLTGLNHQLVVVVIVSSIVFITFIILGRLSNRNRFLQPGKKRE